MRRVHSSITIENVVRVRLQNRVNHVGLMAVERAQQQQMFTPNFVREGIQTAEEIVDKRGKEELMSDIGSRNRN